MSLSATKIKQQIRIENGSDSENEKDKELSDQIENEKVDDYQLAQKLERKLMS